MYIMTTERQEKFHNFLLSWKVYLHIFNKWNFLRLPVVIIVTMDGRALSFSRRFVKKQATVSKFILLALLLIATYLFGGCGSTTQVITSLSASPSTVVIGKTASINCQISAASGVTYTYSWNATGGSFSTNFGNPVTWTAPSTAGNYTISVTVSGNDGTTNSASINITVLTGSEESSGQCPIIDKIYASVYKNISPGNTVDLSCEAHRATSSGSTETSSSLQYIWSADEGSITGSGKTTTWIAPESNGTYHITVKVLDNTTGYYSLGYLSLIVSGEGGDSNIINITEVGYTPSTLYPGDTATLSCKAEIISGTTTIRSYTWTVDGGNLTGGGVGASTAWKAPSGLVSETTYHATVEVKDSDNNKIRRSFPIVVSPSIEAPAISSVSASPTSITTSQTSQITCNATDPNSPARTLTYSWTVTSGSCNPASSSAQNYTTYTPAAAGTYNIQVKVTNGGSSYATGYAQVTVTSP
jgi:hypothetical protein